MAIINVRIYEGFDREKRSCSGYYQRKSFGSSPGEPDARRSAMESAQCSCCILASIKAFASCHLEKAK